MPASPASCLLRRQPLAWLNAQRVKILYLAKYAPSPDSPKPILHPSLGVTPVYHHEIYAILLALGFQVEPSSSLGRLMRGPSDYHYVFSLFNRAPFAASEVFVSTVCEYLRVAYLGATPHVRSLAEDKHLTKLLARQLGIPVPDWKVYRRGVTPVTPPSFAGPYLVKPRCGAGSMHITEESLQEQWSDLQPHLRKIQEHGHDALVERFIAGSNVTVPVLGGNPPLVLPPVVADSPRKGNVITNAQKRMLDRSLTRHVLMGSSHENTLRTLASQLYYSTEPVDYFRVDYRVPEVGDSPPVLLEINICCNLGSHSSMTLAAAAIGMSQEGMVAHILDHSLRRQGFDR